MWLSRRSVQKLDAQALSVVSPEAYQDAHIEGKIQDTKPAKKSNKAEISFAFTTLIKGEKRYPIEADLAEVSNSKGVKNVDEEGRVIGKSSMKKKLAGTAAGAGIGAAIGALAGGGKGAGIGAAAGAGAGLLLTIGFTTSGSDIEFLPGSVFTMTVSDRSR